MFENTVILDPNFALAYAAIANVCARNHYNYGRDPVWMQRAMKASETAVVLRPEDAREFSWRTDTQRSIASMTRPERRF